MNKVIILAYNEAKFISKTIEAVYEYFDEIIVVDDKSKDKTLEIITDLKKTKSKINILSNKKNYGAGRSLELGIAHALKSPCSFIVKIDGDNQFEPKDVLKIIELAEKRQIDFIKCDRFWSDGIKGQIPKIRYLGNTIASILVKFTTSNKRINDPLNGLFLFSNHIARNIKFPKIFYRYGYPFYINALISKYALLKNFKLFQYKNVVTYADEESKLNPIIIFSKLTLFSLYNFISTIKIKFRNSEHQISGILDVLSIICFLCFSYSVKMLISIEFSNYQGNKGAWAILATAFLLLTLKVISNSQKTMGSSFKSQFDYLN